MPSLQEGSKRFAESAAKLNAQIKEEAKQIGTPEKEARTKKREVSDARKKPGIMEKAMRFF